MINTFIFYSVEHDCCFYELSPFSYSLFLKEVVVGVKFFIDYFSLSS